VTGALVKGKGAAEEGEGVAVVSVSGSRLGVAVSGEAEGLTDLAAYGGLQRGGSSRWLAGGSLGDRSQRRLGGGSGSGGKRGKARRRPGGRRGAVQCVSEWE
jgi:hypothetical protein